MGVGTSPPDLCSRWGTRAELPETLPWWQIGAAQFVWPLFAQPGLLAGEKVCFTRAFAPSLFLLDRRTLEPMQLPSPRTQLQLSSIIFEPCVSYTSLEDLSHSLDRSRADVSSRIFANVETFLIHWRKSCSSTSLSLQAEKFAL
jgi:hypothetical protein